MRNSESKLIVKAWYNKEGSSNVLIYGDDQWVAYMEENSTTWRTDK